MAINSLPDTLKSTKWSKDPGKSAAAPVTTSLKTFEAAHAAVDWKAAEVGKPTTAAQVDTLKKKIEAAQKQLDKADAEAKKVAAAAGKLANDKEAGKDAKAAQTAAAAFSKGAESFFSAALKELDEATKAIAKAAGKQIPNAGKDASAGAPVNKADDQLLVKLCKKAIQSAMKPKPGAPSMQFAIIGKQGTPLRVLMGTKTEIAKLIGKFGKVDPKTKKKPPIAKDPKSRLLFENGALVFETAKIPAGVHGRREARARQADQEGAEDQVAQAGPPGRRGRQPVGSAHRCRRRGAARQGQRCGAGRVQEGLRRRAEARHERRRPEGPFGQGEGGEGRDRR